MGILIIIILKKDFTLKVGIKDINLNMKVIGVQNQNHFNQDEEDQENFKQILDKTM